jgi:V/A-type H+-transporting ATPase subunit E
VAKSKQSGKNASVEVASGVDALISRLRDEGVQSGRQQAEQIVKDAQIKAETTIKQARQESEQIISKARGEVEDLKRAAKEALELAFRDTVLALKAQLTQRFNREVQRLVGEEVQRQEILEKMILEVAGRVKEDVDQSQQVEVLLPRKIVGLEEISRHPEKLKEGVLTRFVRLTNKGLIREGVSFGVAKDDLDGLRIRLVDKEVVLDLSERAVADAILKHLQPRFRALLEGVIK